MEYLILDNGQVLEEKEPNIWTHFDSEHHIKLTTDKTTLLADGVDTATITAKIYDYLDVAQNHAITLIVSIKGEDTDITDTVDTVNGEATLEFNTLTLGQFTITVNYEGYRGEEVIINAE